jgi:hypothetical protein
MRPQLVLVDAEQSKQKINTFIFINILIKKPSNDKIHECQTSKSFLDHLNGTSKRQKLIRLSTALIFSKPVKRLQIPKELLP